MEKARLYVRLLVSSILLLPISFKSSAQEITAGIKQESELVKNRKDKSFHSLYTGIGYGNNMIYMGSNVSNDQPFYSGSITYGFKNELFLSLSANHLSAFDPFLAFSDLSLSYIHDFSSWLDLSLSVSRYQVNRELTDTLFNNFFYGNLAAGFDWNIFYTNISVGGIFSESSGVYFNLKNSRYIKTPELFNGNGYFYFDPYLNLLFGTLTKTVTSDGTSIGVSPPFKTGKSSGGGGGGGNISGTTTTFFSLMEVDLGLPIGFTIGKLTIEAEPGYVLPAYSDDENQSPKGFTLFLNLNYMIF